MRDKRVHLTVVVVMLGTVSTARGDVTAFDKDHFHLDQLTGDAACGVSDLVGKEAGFRVASGRLDDDDRYDIVFTSLGVAGDSTDCPPITIAFQDESVGDFSSASGIYWANTSSAPNLGVQLLAADLFSSTTLDALVMAAPGYGTVFVLESQAWDALSCYLPTGTPQCPVITLTEATAETAFGNGGLTLNSDSSGQVLELIIAGDTTVTALPVSTLSDAPQSTVFSLVSSAVIRTVLGADLSSASSTHDEILVGLSPEDALVCPATTSDTKCSALSLVDNRAVESSTQLEAGISLVGLPSADAVYQLTSGTNTTSKCEVKAANSKPDGFGTAVLGMDVDQDGEAEMVVSAVGTSASKIYVLRPQACSSGSYTATNLVVYSESSNSELGSSLAAVPYVCPLAGEENVAPGLLVGAPGAPAEGKPPVILLCPTEVIDADGDGAELSEDCDDQDAANRPGGSESCDDQDNNCDGSVDEELSTRTYYPDSDGDGHGASGSTGVVDCAQPAGYSTSSDDCNDADSTIYTGASETCDGKDNDCDGSVDESASNGATVYQDSDGDGYGDPLVSIRSCVVPTGYAGNDDDCDDTDPNAYPGASELCNGKDDDCDKEVDDGATDTFYEDADGDRYGDTGSESVGCTPPEYFVPNGGDCDDTNPYIYPGAAEECTDSIDNDCDGELDDGETDVDGDLHLDQVCEGGDDCDDSDPSTYTNAVEICDNGKNNNCDPAGEDNDGVCEAGEQQCNGNDDDGDGRVDDGFDNDDDHFTSCLGDCNDKESGINPGALETCNGVDDDCDGAIDEGDRDGDGWTDCAEQSADDSDDQLCYADPARFPGQEEECDQIDNDCDGEVDDGFDLDSDGASTCGDGESELDCDDGDPSIFPGAPETCNEIDEDCDGELLETFDSSNGQDFTLDCVDDDGDGYTEWGGSASAVQGDEDCNDRSSTLHPGAVEVCDALDNDCDLAVDEGFDHDGDGYTLCGPAGDGYYSDCNDASAAMNPDQDEVCNGYDDDCNGIVDDLDCDTSLDDDGDGLSENEGDCDDGNPERVPGAPELCDGVDNNCGTTTEAAEHCGWDTPEERADEDFDLDCDGYTTCGLGYGGGTDCDDSSATIHPGATELCDCVDDDCDGTVDESGSAGEVCLSCTDSDGDLISTSEGDCDDQNSSASPQLIEICDGIDNDCDAEVDEDFDYDGDGYTTCGLGTQGRPADCDDLEAVTYPGAEEACDGIDNDCDELADDAEASDGTGGLECDTDGDNTRDLFDEDGDGFCESDPRHDYQLCAIDEDGTAAIPGDCDDTNADRFPGNAEIGCDGIDQDCSCLNFQCSSQDDSQQAELGDGADQNGDQQPDCIDLDSDGYSVDGSAGGMVDCDDTHMEVHPGAAEICDDLDNDCDGLYDEDVGLCCGVTPRTSPSSSAPMLALLAVLLTHLRRARRSRIGLLAAGGITCCLLPLPRAEAECLVRIDAGEIVEHLEKARAANKQLEYATAVQQADSAIEQLPCLGAAIDARTVGEVFFQRGLAIYGLTTSAEPALPYLEQAFILDPIFGEPQWTIHLDAPMIGPFSDFMKSKSREERIKIEPGWSGRREVRIDGKRIETTMILPLGRHVAQVRSPPEAFWCTDWLTVSEPGPLESPPGKVELRAARAALKDCREEPVVVFTRQRDPRPTWLAVTGGLALASGISVVLLNQAYSDLSTQEEAGARCPDSAELSRLCRRHHALFVGTWLLLGATGGAGLQTYRVHRAYHRSLAVSGALAPDGGYAAATFRF